MGAARKVEVELQKIKCQAQALQRNVQWKALAASGMGSFDWLRGPRSRGSKWGQGDDPSQG